MKRLSILLFLLISCTHNHQSPVEINFDHLERLTETVTLDGKECDIIHIYSEYPDYNWVDASSEGIACVDDVARAAVLYVRYYELTKDASVLHRAKRLLNFVLHMQAENGEFYNFIEKEMHINRTGETSRKLFGFWAVRGYWALGAGYRIFKDVEPEYAGELKKAFLKCRQPIENLLQNYGQYRTVAGRNYPQWLIYKNGSDAAADLILALVEFLKCQPDLQLSDYAVKLAEGIVDMQVNDESDLNGAFLSWPGLWHAWGNSQTQALASLGAVLNNQHFIEAAQKEADNFYAFLLQNGRKSEWRYATGEFKEFPQIAYDVRCMTAGLLRLHDATGDQKYADMASQAASWFTGNNAAHHVMYDPESGRCLDGINDSTSVNLNAGAESTIEALLTLVELSKYAQTLKILELQK